MTVWTAHAMRSLARSFDERVRRDVPRYDRLTAAAEERGSVLRDPAGEARIARAEQRLGVRLPASYRAFLLVSDGAYASALGAELEDQWQPHGLLPVDQVQWTSQADPLGIEVWCDTMNDPAEDRPPKEGRATTVGYFEPYRHGLLITPVLDANLMALVPRAGVREWELWEVYKEGASAYPSFASFLECYATRRDTRPRPDEADSLVERFVSGQSYTLPRLAELGDPRAAELARSALAAGATNPGIPQLLGKLGDRTSVPLLRHTYHSSPNWDVRAAALGALQRLRTADAPELLAAAARDENRHLRAWAQATLQREKKLS